MPLPCGENFEVLAPHCIFKKRRRQGALKQVTVQHLLIQNIPIGLASIQDSKIKCFLEQLPLIQGFQGNWFMDSTGQVLFFLGYG